MRHIAVELKRLVIEFAERHADLTEETTCAKLSESKWTPKEIIGRLIDSASNNHQRITRLQPVEELHFPSHETEALAAITTYGSKSRIFSFYCEGYYD
jgi:hypothetical protein